MIRHAVGLDSLENIHLGQPFDCRGATCSNTPLQSIDKLVSLQTHEVPRRDQREGRNGVASPTGDGTCASKEVVWVRGDAD
jgi:hypothetical protein